MREKRGLVVLAIALALIVVTSGWWLIAQARAAMIRQVQVTELLAARERSGQLSQAIDAAQQRLEGAARTPVMVAAVAGADRDTLLATISAAAQLSPVVGVAVRLEDGRTLVEVGDAPSGSERTLSSTDHHDGFVVLSADVVDDRGIALGSLVAKVSLLALSPRLEDVLAEFDGATSVATRSGAVVMTSATRSADTVQSAELLRLLAAGEVAVETYHSPVLDTDRIGAVAPVAGTDLMVIVGADAAAANEPAADLVRRLGAGFLVSVVASAVVVGGSVTLLRRGRRTLVREREEAQQLAFTDSLTGLGNRRTLDAWVEDRAHSDALFGVVAIDLDHLKQINDGRGHEAGDTALREVARAIRTAVRPEDLVARIGGDEFIVVLPGGDLDRARAVADRIRDLVAGGAERWIAVSVGAAAASGRNLRLGLAQADRDLYVAKAGRARAEGHPAAPRST